MRLLKARTVSIHPLTEEAARQVGVLLGRTGTSDVVDGHVAFLARGLDARVITSDPDDIRKLDADLELISL